MVKNLSVGRFLLFPCPTVGHLHWWDRDQTCGSEQVEVERKPRGSRVMLLSGIRCCLHYELEAVDWIN